MKRNSAVPLAVVLFLLASLPLAAQDRPTVNFYGFISATAFAQDQRFGFTNGQATEWASLTEFEEDEWFVGGDVRNTRLGLAVAGPEVAGGWKVNGVIEMDFFGGFSNPGPFGDEQPNPRLRLAYADLTRGGTTLRIGQAWTPLFGFVPVSLSHLAFPLGYGSAGMIGWRYPGIYLYQELTGKDAPLKAQFTAAAFRGSWVATPAELVVDNLSPGEAAAIPQLEARLDLSGKSGNIPWAAYVVGHYDRKDLSGAGAEAEDDELTGTAVEAGARITPGPLTLHGNAYWGESIGQQFGHITQFGDITGRGAWVQAGYALTPRWSVWGFYGIADPEDEDVRGAALTLPTPIAPNRSARLQNQMFQTMLRYNVGPYSLGLEWIRAETEWGTRTGVFQGNTLVSDVSERVERSANQIAFSMLFTF